MNAAWLAAVGTLAAMVAVPALLVAVVREWAAMERRRVERAAAWKRGRLAMEREYLARRNGRLSERPDYGAAYELPMAEGGQQERPAVKRSGRRKRRTLSGRRLRRAPEKAAGSAESGRKRPWSADGARMRPAGDGAA